MNKSDVLVQFQGSIEAKGCTLEKINTFNYTIHNYTTVSWAEKRTKLGKFFIQEKGVKFAFDFPVNYFSLEELKELVDFPYTDDPANTNVSYLNCSINKDKFDTLRVRVINEDLSDFNFTGDKFKRLLQLIISANN